MFSSNNNNTEIDMDETYMKYGQCRCCMTKGQHRDVNKEYFYKNIKEVYRDLFAECFNLLLSPHEQISPLICDSCVQRLREASTFRMMVASNEEQLLKAVIFKSEPENENLFFDAQQNFTTDVKIETDSEPDVVSEPHVFQEDLESSTDNDEPVDQDVLMNDEAWIDDKEVTTDEEPENQDKVEQTDVVKLVNDKRTNEETWVNGNGQVNGYKRTNDDDWRDANEQMNDEDDWSTDTDNELVIDEDRENDSSGTEEFLTDEDLDDCGSIFSSTITRSSTSAVDDEPSAMVKGEKRLLSRTAPVRLLPKRRHLAKIYPEFDEHLRKLEYKLVTPKSLEWFFKTPEMKVPEIKPPERKPYQRKPHERKEIKSKRVYNKRSKEDKEALAANATTLFEFSNATAFKTKMRNGYPCFYCREVYNYNRLKEHQETKHPKSTIFNFISKYNADEFVIYAEITDLKCTICEKSLKDLKELRTHLSEEHEKKLLKAADRIIPFKLQETDFECQICGQIFETFGAVEKHMNAHFGSFMCDICGTAFITKHRLAVHSYASHKDAKVVCELCNRTFRTQMKLRIHFEGVHESRRTIKCTKCPEQFIDHFTRQKHLMDVHGESTKRYSCNECDKAFSRRFGLNVHIKRCHIVQRVLNCERCTYECLTQYEMREHMLIHGGETLKFECTFCKKVYNRKRSLAMHVKVHKKVNNNPVGPNNSVVVDLNNPNVLDPNIPNGGAPNNSNLVDNSNQ